MEPLERLHAGIDQAEGVVGRVDRSQYDLPTPCADWGVGQVINHMIGALTMFKELAENGSADPEIFVKDLIGDDPAKSLATAGAAAVAGWSAPGKMDGTAVLPFGEFPAYFALQLPAMDMVVHSWDVAKATGLEVDWDPELVADTRAFVEQMLANPEERGTDFGPPVSVGDEADDMSKLVAFLSRTP